jgi:hypothetical protein
VYEVPPPLHIHVVSDGYPSHYKKYLPTCLSRYVSQEAIGYSELRDKLALAGHAPGSESAAKEVSKAEFKAGESRRVP